jgi:cysteine-rich repeat protein
MTVRCSRSIDQPRGSRSWGARVFGLLVLLAATSTQAQISIEIPTIQVGTNAFSDGGTQWPEVDVSTDGTVVFIWAEYFTPLLAVTHAYSADGVELGPPVRVSQSGKVYSPSIVSDLRGGFVAAWDWSENNGNDQTMARRLDGLGNGLGSQIVVNGDRPTRNALLVRAAGLPSGSVFMWEQGRELYFRLYDANGVSRGPSTVLAYEAITLNVTNDVVGLSNGGFVGAWADLYNGRSWARIYDGNGQPLGPQFVLSDDFDMQRLAAFPGGWAAIGTTSNREWSNPPPPVYTSNRVIVRRFDNQGLPLGDEIVVHDAGFRVWLQTDLTFDRRGNLYATWLSENWDWPNTLSPPYARAFDANGNALGAAIAVSDKRGYDVHPAALPNGNIVSIWEGQGNVPYETAVFATWVRVCPGDEPCEAAPMFTPFPSPTPSATPSATATPVPTPGCGDGHQDKTEECDDGNRVNGDGCDSRCLLEKCGNRRIEGTEQCDPPTADGRCRADCTLAPAHDSVMVPQEPIDVVIAASQQSVTKIVPMQVRNADIEPSPEKPGHVIRMVASDGTCPAGTILGLPDFERGIEGDQDSILVAGGTPKTAHVVVFASRGSFPKLDAKIPQRCTLVFTAETLIAGNVDPTPENNRITVELNVRAVGNANDDSQPKDGDIIVEPGFFVRSLKPLRVRIRAGKTSARKSAKFRVTNGLPFGSPDRQVQLEVDDGTCPPGAVAISNFAGVPGGGQTVTLRAGRSRPGKLVVGVAAGSFSSANRQSPGRCTATLIVSDPSGSEERTNQRTALVIEATDFNDFRR